MEEVIFNIRRFNGIKSYWQRFKVPVKRGMTLLEGLYYIKENLDGSLAFRASCRMGICGSCAVRVNGKPMLACETQILDLKAKKLDIEPLDNMKVLKDLVVEFDDFFKKHEAVKPYLIRDDVSYSNPVELLQTPEELKEYYDFTLCIKCGSCYSVCPAASTRGDYLGPAALTAAYRFCADSRDKGKKERLEAVSGTDGVWRCHFAAECSEVCPKRIEPAKAVQKMRRSTAGYMIKKIFR